ncbi:metallophosphatase family protein [Pantoea sp. ACRSH]|uniref:metallophosphoesterase family protein n=1 Tax=unclassified Pantoea TaxID=2630326 RepID=UPI001EF41A0A|nr:MULTISPECIES: metallophosphoesterase family protein [unclassified Pantoea]MCG7367469.1 metallophosphatase family protein [Pantoea sp. ACRSH]MCG7397979.1 metallophosphatase family protein [Pantoea sp. ACRSC]MDT0177797.1 metallophosphoesterase family protein [Enterobacter sp. BRE11]
MKLAVISDIHGNLPALDAVLADIQSQGVDQIVNLGDIVSGGLFPAETADRLMPLDIPTVRGNHERQLLELDFSDMSLSDRHAFKSLQAAHWRWLKNLPAELTFSEDILMVHGVPGDDLVYLLEEVTASGVRPSSEARVLALIASRSESLILCGHTHIPRKMRLADGRLIVNPGSVGLQAYDDDTPCAHVMESGSPHARYAIVEQHNGLWNAELRAVEYDWESAALVASANNRPDWLNALRTGRM